MKSMKFAILLLMAFSVIGCKEESKDKMSEQQVVRYSEIIDNKELNNTVIVNANADDVWGLLRKMDDIAKYSSTIAIVEWVGPKDTGGQRICTSPDGKGQFKEDILTFNDQHRSYSYAVSEGTPTKNMVNSFKVVNLGYHKSAIVWSSKYDAFMENSEMTEMQFVTFMDSASKEMMNNIAKASTKL